MIGKRNGKKLVTQHAAKVAVDGFPVGGSCDCAIELGTNLRLFFNQFMAAKITAITGAEGKDLTTMNSDFSFSKS
jgi:hypothetical protein